VDRWLIPVGEPFIAWDEVWAARATIAPVPRLSTERALSSTRLPSRNSAPDLRGRRFSTVSTAPKTTSLRQGSVMTQAVRNGPMGNGSLRNKHVGNEQSQWGAR